jgi:hypothetical protein
MSREYVDALRAVYDEWGKGNFRAGADLYDRHVLFVLHPGFPEAGVYVGTDQLREYMLGLLGAWTNFTIAAEDFVEAGTRRRGGTSARRGEGERHSCRAAVLHGVDVPWRDDGPIRELPRPSRGPRSRGAAGVALPAQGARSGGDAPAVAGCSDTPRRAVRPLELASYRGTVRSLRAFLASAFGRSRGVSELDDRFLIGRARAG